MGCGILYRMLAERVGLCATLATRRTGRLGMTPKDYEYLLVAQEATHLIVLSLRHSLVVLHWLVVASTYVAPPSCPLVVPPSRPLILLSLCHHLVVSSCRLVVASPLVVPPSCCPLTLPHSCCLAPAGCCVASCRAALSSSHRAAFLSSHHPLTALPSCCLIAPAGCCVASCHTALLSSHCAALLSSCSGWLLRCFSLRRPLVLSSSSHCAALLSSHLTGWLWHRLSLFCSLVVLS
jgi:hypothetical protein